MNLLETLKKRWGLDSGYQIIIILVVFSLTGISVVYLKPVLYQYLKVPEDMAIWLKVFVWLFTILPMYYVLLLFYGTLLGQRTFFWWFAKKAFMRFLPTFSKNKNTTAE